MVQVYKRRTQDGAVRTPGGRLSIQADPDAFGAAEARGRAFNANLLGEAARSQQASARASQARSRAGFEVASVLGDIFLKERAKTDEIDFQRALHDATSRSEALYMPDGAMRSKLGDAQGLTQRVDGIYQGLMQNAGNLNPRIQGRYLAELAKLRRSDLMTAADRESSQMDQYRAQLRAERRSAELNRASSMSIDALMREDGFDVLDASVADARLGEIEDELGRPDTETMAAALADNEVSQGKKPPAPPFASKQDGEEYLASIGGTLFRGDAAQALEDLNKVKGMLPRELHAKASQYEAAALKSVEAQIIAEGRAILREGGMPALEDYIEQQSENLSPVARQYVQDLTQDVLSARHSAIGRKIDDLIADGDRQGARILVEAKIEDGTLQGAVAQAALGKLEAAEGSAFVESAAEQYASTFTGPDAIREAVSADLNAGTITQQQADAVLPIALARDSNEIRASEEAVDALVQLPVDRFGDAGFTLSAEEIAVYGADAPAVEAAGRFSAHPEASDPDALRRLEEMNDDELAALGPDGLLKLAPSLSQQDYRTMFAKMAGIRLDRRKVDLLTAPWDYQPTESDIAVLGRMGPQWAERRKQPPPEVREAFDEEMRNREKVVAAVAENQLLGDPDLVSRSDVQIQHWMQDQGVAVEDQPGILEAVGKFRRDGKHLKTLYPEAPGYLTDEIRLSAKQMAGFNLDDDIDNFEDRALIDAMEIELRERLRAQARASERPVDRTMFEEVRSQFLQEQVLVGSRDEPEFLQDVPPAGGLSVREFGRSGWFTKERGSTVKESESRMVRLRMLENGIDVPTGREGERKVQRLAILRRSLDQTPKTDDEAFNLGAHAASYMHEAGWQPNDLLVLNDFRPEALPFLMVYSYASPEEIPEDVRYQLRMIVGDGNFDWWIGQVFTGYEQFRSIGRQ